MGTSGSKPLDKSSALPCGSLPVTPISTPMLRHTNSEQVIQDPRSPSKHIARTPIEVLTTVANKLENLNIKSDKLPVETPLKRHLILGIDPRSPTIELQRTPIVVNNPSEANPSVRIRNKNLDKVKQSLLLDTPTITVPPRLLDSAPATPKIESETYKRKSLVLLETNIDFTETDLDRVIQEKYAGNNLEDGALCVEDDPRSPFTDFLQTPIQVCAATDSIITENDCIDMLVEDSVGVTNENIEVNIEEPMKCDFEEEIGQLKEDSVVINCEEVASITEHKEPICRSAPISPPAPIILTPEKSKSQPLTPSLMDITANVRELDKKLTNLIYEDGDLVVSPKIVKLKDPSRTPLGLRNGSNNLKKITHKLTVSDKPRKTNARLSKIPVFKEKKVKVQCENTPPRGMRGAKSKKTQWDSKDDTLVI